MEGGGFFRGTNLDQDARFSNKEKKLMDSMKFPPEFDKKLDVKKVHIDSIKPWIAKKVTELLGTEDEIVINFIFGMVEQEEINPKRLQINLTPFLEKKTAGFVKELWDLMLSAQDNIGGIPTIILEQKQRELMQLKEQNDRANQLIQEARFRTGNGELTYGLNQRSNDVKPENLVIPMENKIDERRDRGRGDRDRNRDDRRDRERDRDRHRDRDRDRDRHRDRDRDRDRHRRSRRSRSRSRDRDRHRRRRSTSPHSSDSDRDEKRSKKDKSSRRHHHHRSSKDKDKKEKNEDVKEESNEQLEELRQRALETMKEERTTTE